LWWVLFFLSVISYRYILSSMCFVMAFSLCNLIWIHLIFKVFLMACSLCIQIHLSFKVFVMEFFCLQSHVDTFMFKVFFGSFLSAISYGYIVVVVCESSSSHVCASF
jgi:hypothetical protein